MIEEIGIKTDEANRIRVRGELIVGNMDGLIADLGNGFFVVTKEAHNALIKLGIELQVQEIHRGKPRSSNKGEPLSESQNANKGCP